MEFIASRTSLPTLFSRLNRIIGLFNNVRNGTENQPNSLKLNTLLPILGPSFKLLADIVILRTHF